MKLSHRQKQPAARTRRQSDISNRQGRPGYAYYGKRPERPVEAERPRGSQPSSKPKRQHLSSYVWQRTGLLILLLAAALLLASSLTLSTAPKIVVLANASNRIFLRSSSTYQTGASAILTSSIWNNSKLTINTIRIGQQLQQKFPELSAVDITLPLLGHRPVIYLQPSQPAFIINGDNGGFVMDNDGKIVVPVNQLPPNFQLHLPTVSDQSGLSLSPGRSALTRDNVQFIQAVLAELSARHIAVANMVLPAGGGELDIYPTGQPYFAKFNLHASYDDARQQAGTFIAVENKLASENIAPGKYIDVRVDGRAYYL